MKAVSQKRRKKNKNLLKGNIGLGGKIFIVVTCAVLLIYCASLIYPLVWAIMTSFKDIIEYTLNPLGFPRSWAFDNYSIILRLLYVDVFFPGIGLVRYGPLEMVLNTVILAITRPFLSTMFTLFAAYAIAKLKPVGGRFLYNLGIVVMLIPIVGSFPSQMKIYRELGIYDNMFMQIIINGGSFSGMAFLMLYAALKKIPDDYSDAAFIDGASQARVFFKIVMPMVLPTAAVFFFTGFLGAWNDYTTSLIWLPSKPTLAYGMYMFQATASRGTATVPQIMAGFLIIMIPTIVLYFFMQDLIISKLQIGGLKE